eukprot:4002495-Karenia_brevis.AAC.1
MSDAFFQLVSNWSDAVHVPGRIVQHTLTTSAGVIDIFNSHHHNLDSAGSGAARCSIHQCINSALENPFSHLVLLLGDFNKMRRGELRHDLDPPDHAEYVNNYSQHVINTSQDDNSWDAVFD